MREEGRAALALTLWPMLETHTRAAEALMTCADCPWTLLENLKEWILRLGETLPREAYDALPGGVWIAKCASVAPTAYIGGPCVIGERSEIRHGAYIRGSALVGDGVVVGNSTELKNCILFDGVQVPHYNYVGDSILGYRAHLGAGAITANVRLDKGEVTVKQEGKRWLSGRRKLGALIGDGAEIGCNSVLCPGACIPAGTRILPGSVIR